MGLLTGTIERNTYLTVAIVILTLLSVHGTLHAQWIESGVPIVVDSSEQTDHHIVPLEDGNVIFVWQDYRNGDRNVDVYAQKINCISSGRRTSGLCAVRTAINMLRRL